jgi:hypothetical protein
MEGHRMFTSFRSYARSVFLPQDAGQTALPRLDLLVMAFAAMAALVLVAADVFQRAIYYRNIPTLDIDGQYNVETWFHAVVLGGVALCALGIAFTHFTNARRLQWLGAAAGIAFFSLDKSISLHERAGIAIVNRLDLPRERRVAWRWYSSADPDDRCPSDHLRLEISAEYEDVGPHRAGACGSFGHGGDGLPADATRLGRGRPRYRLGSKRISRDGTAWDSRRSWPDSSSCSSTG